MLAETGAVGLLVYFAFWVVLIAAAAKSWKEKTDRASNAFFLGFLLSLAIVSFTGEFMIPRSPGSVAPAIAWWLLIAILLTDVDQRYQWFRWPRR
jgi:O-antigen ligase